MAKQKAQAGKKIPMKTAIKKRDSLSYDAQTSMQASKNRTTKSGGSFDSIAKQLKDRAIKSDSLSKVMSKNIEKAKKKS